MFTEGFERHDLYRHYDFIFWVVVVALICEIFLRYCKVLFFLVLLDFLFDVRISSAVIFRGVVKIFVGFGFGYGVLWLR